jgi:hypothetical protein
MSNGIVDDPRLGAVMLDQFVVRALERAALGIDISDMPQWAKDRARIVRRILRPQIRALRPKG